MTPVEIIGFTVILIVFLVAIYYVYPQSVYYIPEVKRLYTISKDIEAAVIKNNELTAKLAGKMAELDTVNRAWEVAKTQISTHTQDAEVYKKEIVSLKNDVESAKKELDSCNVNLAKLNADLVKSMSELEDYKKKYEKLTLTHTDAAKYIIFINEDLSDAHRLLMKSAQTLIDHHVNFSPESKQAFTKLYLSILDLGLMGTKEICKYKTQLIDALDSWLMYIKSTGGDVLLCDIPRMKIDLTNAIQNLLYRRATTLKRQLPGGLPPAGSILLDVQSSNPDYVHYLRPKLHGELGLAARQVADNAQAYILTLLAYFCESGKLNASKIRKELEHHLSVLKC